jgi:hypothetical protein
MKETTSKGHGIRNLWLGMETRKPIRLVLFIVLIAAFVVTSIRVVQAASYGVDLVQIKRGHLVQDDHGTREPRGHLVQPFAVLDTAGTLSTFDVAGRTCLILYYDSQCRFCHLNMSRWLEILAALKGSHIPVYGFALHYPRTQLADWRGLTDNLQLLVPTRDSALISEFGADMTPATIVVKQGRVASTFVGVLNRRQQNAVLTLLQEK